MNFDDVPDCAMLVLMALKSGEKMDVHEGEPAIRSGGEWLPVSESVLASLEEREWIEHNASGSAPTRQGEYAIDRWLVLRFGKKAKDSVYRLTAKREAV